MEVENNLRTVMNFYRKQCLSVIVWNKNHLPREVASITYTLESFSQLLFLKVCDSFLSDRVKKTCAILWSVGIFLGFPERKRQNTVFEY